MTRSFMATMSDPALIAEANKAGMELGERGGGEVQTLVTRLYALTARVIERAKQAMIYKAPAR